MTRLQRVGGGGGRAGRGQAQHDHVQLTRQLSAVAVGIVLPFRVLGHQHARAAVASRPGAQQRHQAPQRQVRLTERRMNHGRQLARTLREQVGRRVKNVRRRLHVVRSVRAREA